MKGENYEHPGKGPVCHEILGLSPFLQREKKGSFPVKTELARNIERGI